MISDEVKVLLVLVVLFVTLVASGTYAVIDFLRHLRQGRSVPALCPSCGYDRRARSSELCPECGRAPSARARPRWGHRLALGAGLALLLLGCGASGVGLFVANPRTLAVAGHRVDMVWELGVPLLLAGAALIVVSGVHLLSSARAG
jgi:hypothetical protein